MKSYVVTQDDRVQQIDWVHPDDPPGEIRHEGIAYIRAGQYVVGRERAFIYTRYDRDLNAIAMDRGWPVIPASTPKVET